MATHRDLLVTLVWDDSFQGGVWWACPRRADVYEAFARSYRGVLERCDGRVHLYTGRSNRGRRDALEWVNRTLRDAGMEGINVVD